MALEPGNLGQIIGRLQMALAEAENPKAVHGRRPGHADRVRKLLAEHPDGLKNGEIVRLLSLPPVTVGATIGKMKDVEKTGEKGAYVFRLKVPA